MTDYTNARNFLIVIAVGLLLMLASYGVYRKPEKEKEPTGEYVSGAAIAQEEAKEEWPEFKLWAAERPPLERGIAYYPPNIHIGSLDGPTFADIVDRLSVLEKTIAACCGTDTVEPGAEENLRVMVMLRRKVEELEMRVEALEGVKP